MLYLLAFPLVVTSLAARSATFSLFAKPSTDPSAPPEGSWAYLPDTGRMVVLQASVGDACGITVDAQTNVGTLKVCNDPKAFLDAYSVDEFWNATLTSILQKSEGFLRCKLATDQWTGTCERVSSKRPDSTNDVDAQCKVADNDCKSGTVCVGESTLGVCRKIRASAASFAGKVCTQHNDCFRYSKEAFELSEQLDGASMGDATRKFAEHMANYPCLSHALYTSATAAVQVELDKVLEVHAKTSADLAAVADVYGSTAGLCVPKPSAGGAVCASTFGCIGNTRCVDGKCVARPIEGPAANQTACDRDFDCSADGNVKCVFVEGVVKGKCVVPRVIPEGGQCDFPPDQDAIYGKSALQAAVCAPSTRCLWSAPGVAKCLQCSLDHAAGPSPRVAGSCSDVGMHLQCNKVNKCVPASPLGGVCLVNSDCAPYEVTDLVTSEKSFTRWRDAKCCNGRCSRASWQDVVVEGKAGAEVGQKCNAHTFCKHGYPCVKTAEENGVDIGVCARPGSLPAGSTCNTIAPTKMVVGKCSYDLEGLDRFMSLAAGVCAPEVGEGRLGWGCVEVPFSMKSVPWTGTEKRCSIVAEPGVNLDTKAGEVVCPFGVPVSVGGTNYQCPLSTEASCKPSNVRVTDGEGDFLAPSLSYGDMGVSSRAALELSAQIGEFSTMSALFGWDIDAHPDLYAFFHVLEMAFRSDSGSTISPATAGSFMTSMFDYNIDSTDKCGLNIFDGVSYAACGIDKKCGTPVVSEADQKRIMKTMAEHRPAMMRHISRLAYEALHHPIAWSYYFGLVQMPSMAKGMMDLIDAVADVEVLFSDTSVKTALKTGMEQRGMWRALELMSQMQPLRLVDPAAEAPPTAEDRGEPISVTAMVHVAADVSTKVPQLHKLFRAYISANAGAHVLDVVRTDVQVQLVTVTPVTGATGRDAQVAATSYRSEVWFWMTLDAPLFEGDSTIPEEQLWAWKDALEAAAADSTTTFAKMIVQITETGTFTLPDGYGSNAPPAMVATCPRSGTVTYVPNEASSEDLDDMDVPEMHSKVWREYGRRYAEHVTDNINWAREYLENELDEDVVPPVSLDALKGAFARMHETGDLQEMAAENPGMQVALFGTKILKPAFFQNSADLKDIPFISYPAIVLHLKTDFAVGYTVDIETEGLRIKPIRMEITGSFKIEAATGIDGAPSCNSAEQLCGGSAERFTVAQVIHLLTADPARLKKYADAQNDATALGLTSEIRALLQAPGAMTIPYPVLTPPLGPLGVYVREEEVTSTYGRASVQADIVNRRAGVKVGTLVMTNYFLAVDQPDGAKGLLPVHHLADDDKADVLMHVARTIIPNADATSSWVSATKGDEPSVGGYFPTSSTALHPWQAAVWTKVAASIKEGRFGAQVIDGYEVFVSREEPMENVWKSHTAAAWRFIVSIRLRASSSSSCGDCTLPTFDDAATCFANTKYMCPAFHASVGCGTQISTRSYWRKADKIALHFRFVWEKALARGLKNCAAEIQAYACSHIMQTCNSKGGCDSTDTSRKCTTGGGSGAPVLPCNEACPYNSCPMDILDEVKGGILCGAHAPGHLAAFYSEVLEVPRAGTATNGDAKVCGFTKPLVAATKCPYPTTGTDCKSCIQPAELTAAKIKVGGPTCHDFVSTDSACPTNPRPLVVERITPTHAVIGDNLVVGGTLHLSAKVKGYDKNAASVDCTQYFAGLWSGAMCKWMAADELFFWASPSKPSFLQWLATLQVSASGETSAPMQLLPNWFIPPSSAETRQYVGSYIVSDEDCPSVLSDHVTIPPMDKPSVSLVREGELETADDKGCKSMVVRIAPHDFLLIEPPVVDGEPTGTPTKVEWGLEAPSVIDSAVAPLREELRKASAASLPFVVLPAAVINAAARVPGVSLTVKVRTATLSIPQNASRFFAPYWTGVRDVQAGNYTPLASGSLAVFNGDATTAGPRNASIAQPWMLRKVVEMLTGPLPSNPFAESHELTAKFAFGKQKQESSGSSTARVAEIAAGESVEVWQLAPNPNDKRSVRRKLAVDTPVTIASGHAGILFAKVNGYACEQVSYEWTAKVMEGENDVTTENAIMSAWKVEESGNVALFKAPRSGLKYTVSVKVVGSVNVTAGPFVINVEGGALRVALHVNGESRLVYVDPTDTSTAVAKAVLPNGKPCEDCTFHWQFLEPSKYQKCLKKDAKDQGKDRKQETQVTVDSNAEINTGRRRVAGAAEETADEKAKKKETFGYNIIKTGINLSTPISRLSANGENTAELGGTTGTSGSVEINFLDLAAATEGQARDTIPLFPCVTCSALESPVPVMVEVRKDGFTTGRAFIEVLVTDDTVTEVTLVARTSGRSEELEDVDEDYAYVTAGDKFTVSVHSKENVKALSKLKQWNWTLVAYDENDDEHQLATYSVDSKTTKGRFVHARRDAMSLDTAEIAKELADKGYLYVGVYYTALPKADFGCGGAVGAMWILINAPPVAPTEKGALTCAVASSTGRSRGAAVAFLSSETNLTAVSGTAQICSGIVEVSTEVTLSTEGWLDDYSTEDELWFAFGFRYAHDPKKRVHILTDFDTAATVEITMPSFANRPKDTSLYACSTPDAPAECTEVEFLVAAMDHWGAITICDSVNCLPKGQIVPISPAAADALLTSLASQTAEQRKALLKKPESAAKLLALVNRASKDKRDKALETALEVIDSMADVSAADVPAADTVLGMLDQIASVLEVVAAKDRRKVMLKMLKAVRKMMTVAFKSGTLTEEQVLDAAEFLMDLQCEAKLDAEASVTFGAENVRVFVAEVEKILVALVKAYGVAFGAGIEAGAVVLPECRDWLEGDIDDDDAAQASPKTHTPTTVTTRRGASVLSSRAHDRSATAAASNQVSFVKVFDTPANVITELNKTTYSGSMDPRGFLGLANPTWDSYVSVEVEITYYPAGNNPYRARTVGGTTVADNTPAQMIVVKNVVQNSSGTFRFPITGVLGSAGLKLRDVKATGGQHCNMMSSASTDDASSAISQSSSGECIVPRLFEQTVIYIGTTAAATVGISDATPTPSGGIPPNTNPVPFVPVANTDEDDGSGSVAVVVIVLIIIFVIAACVAAGAYFFLFHKQSRGPKVGKRMSEDQYAHEQPTAADW